MRRTFEWNKWSTGCLPGQYAGNIASTGCQCTSSNDNVVVLFLFFCLSSLINHAPWYWLMQCAQRGATTTTQRVRRSASRALQGSLVSDKDLITATTASLGDTRIVQARLRHWSVLSAILDRVQME